ncbi:unnamed protein product [Amoebophrya sp. A120]|nr:unnamed protein product [Amoebophrya sp. A120]|eukprot:GSA120T00025147001.1
MSASSSTDAPPPASEAGFFALFCGGGICCPPPADPDEEDIKKCSQDIIKKLQGDRFKDMYDGKVENWCGYYLAYDLVKTVLKYMKEYRINPAYYIPVRITFEALGVTQLDTKVVPYKRVPREYASRIQKHFIGEWERFVLVGLEHFLRKDYRLAKVHMERQVDRMKLRVESRGPAKTKEQLMKELKDLLKSLRAKDSFDSYPRDDIFHGLCERSGMHTGFACMGPQFARKQDFSNYSPPPRVSVQETSPSSGGSADGDCDVFCGNTN